MAPSDDDRFTRAEHAAIDRRIAELEALRLLGGEATSLDESGAESILVMPLEDGPPRYVITKRGGRFHLTDADGASVLAEARLDDVLAALP